MKKYLFTVLVLLATTVQAQPWNGPPVGYAPPHQPAAARFDAGSPGHLTRRGLEELMGYLQNGDGDLKKLAAYLESRVAPHFDFQYMARMAAGNLYNRLSDEQRRRLASHIKRQFLSTLVERLGDYDSQQVQVVSQRLGADGRTAVVSTAIYNPQGYPARMDFRFYRSGKGWKVYDVMANGQSAVVHYRNQFRRTLYRSFIGNRSVAPRPAAG